MDTLEKKRIFDWKFIIALTLLTVVAYFVYVGVKSVNQVDELVDANKDLSLLNGTQLKTAARERREASRERQRILDYTQELAERQRKIYQYLINQGIDLPPRFIDPINSPDIDDPSTKENTPTKQKPDKGNNDNSGGNGNGGPNNPPPTEPPKEEELVCLDLLNLEPLCI